MKIAEIQLPNKPGMKPGVKFLKRIRFKCTRCGTFCCHLGAPEFTAEDFKALQKRLGKDLNECIEKREIKTRQEDYLLPYSFKSVNGSECMFLKWGKDGKSKCGVYNSRPILCRTFPFVFEQQGNKISIEVIPCPGLRVSKGKK